MHPVEYLCRLISVMQGLDSWLHPTVGIVSELIEINMLFMQVKMAYTEIWPLTQLIMMNFHMPSLDKMSFGTIK